MQHLKDGQVELDPNVSVPEAGQLSVGFLRDVLCTTTISYFIFKLLWMNLSTLQLDKT